MIKVLNQYLPGRLFVLLVTENVLILLGIWAAVLFFSGTAETSEAFPSLLWKALLITIVCQLCLYYADAYDLRGIGSQLEIFFRLLQAVGAAAILLAALFFVFPDTRLGRGVTETALIAVICAILLWRITVEWVNRRYGPGERILLVGSSDGIHALAREVGRRKDLPLQVLGTLTEEADSVAMTDLHVNALGTMQDLRRVVVEQRPDRVIVGLKERRQQLPVKLLLKLRMSGVRIEDASALYEKIAGKIPVESIRPSAIIFSDGFRHTGATRIYGRVAGFVGGIAGLILLGPVMLLIAILVKLDSSGPALFRQERVGRAGEAFQILKFRSMRVNAESNGPVWAEEDDPRITRVGRWLRKLRLDELPQFVNVLKGDMSFVGPRPERPYFVELLKEQIPFYDLRHAVRPGITGWAQVSHHYGGTVEEAKEKLEYDLFYVKNMSLWLDMLILFQTIKIVMFGRGAR